MPQHECTLEKRPRRLGSVIGIRQEKIDEYRRLHDHAWPQGRQNFLDCNFRNYTLFLRKLDDGHYYLFSYCEYVGDDLDADQRKLAEMPLTQQWWDLCMPCQVPLEGRKEGEWWASMEDIFHID